MGLGPHDSRRGHGWAVHTRDIETINSHTGVRVRSNADPLILFLAGAIASQSPAGVVVIGSGDGDLGTDLAQAIHRLPKKRHVVTMSLAGSTSQRLNAKVNPAIAENIELGLDMLHPMYSRVRRVK